MPYSYDRIWIYAIWLTKERLPLINSSAEIIKQIKGSSSHYINQQSNLIDKFAWQTSYAAHSVSESVVDKVYEYIFKQKQHHQKCSFQAEYLELIKLHGVQTNLI